DLRNLNNNDGHLKGDEYLQKIGEVLNNNSAGLFFRIGGDEFAGLVNRDEKKVREVLDNIYKKLSNLGLTPKLSISTGAAKIEIEKTYLENYETVDKLLYRVKHEGKNNYIIA
ncbi:MAG: diguanylate cyclase domain-containing protein, partial [Cetobacterium sp.]